MNLDPRTASTSRFPVRPVASQSLLSMLQAASAMLFGIFLVLHLSNTLLAIAGPDVYNGVQQRLQLFYQHPQLEWVLVFIPLFVHASIGVYQIFSAARTGKRLTKRQRSHRLAGIFLLAVIFGHVAATRGVGYFYEAPPGFSGVSFSLWWMPWVFYPYYLLLFVAAFSHMLGGILFAARRFTKLQFKWLVNNTKYFNFLAAILVFIALLSFDGRLFKVPDPTDTDYARAYEKIFAVELP